ncbi:hypothetical protein OH492_11120 [Vibrio chagasii]|nr:hypothetical protein [Vibrio chagasii]
MIQLLTNGGPNMIGTSEPAGYTDLLVSYTYRIAFEGGGGGQDFGPSKCYRDAYLPIGWCTSVTKLSFP